METIPPPTNTVAFGVDWVMGMVVPLCARLWGGGIFIGQQPGNLRPAQPFFHVPLKDAAHDLRFRFVDFRPAVVSNPVPIRDGTASSPSEKRHS